MAAAPPPSEDKVAAPVVFQCAACRAIVSDSNFLHHSSEELGLVSLAAARGVTIASEFQTSRGKHDAACTFLALSCEQCGAALGRMYKTTTAVLDHLRDLYSFERERISAYELGSCARVSFDAAAFSRTLDELFERSNKIMRVVLTHEERLRELERAQPPPR